MERDQIRALAEKVRLVALDMDGTCLNSQSVMTPRTREAIQALAEKGVLVVPATGRGVSGLLERTIPVPKIRYVIACNGAIVADLEADKWLLERDIPREGAADLAAAVMDQDATCLHWDCGEGYSVPLPLGCRSQEAYDRYFKEHRTNDRLGPQEMHDWVLSCGKRFYKMGLRFREKYGFEHYEELIGARFPQVDCLRSGIQIEVVRRGVSKGTALKALCAHLGLPAEQVCAVGDNGNDVAMIEFAGLGVAVENAVTEAKEKAAWIAGHHDREGVAQFLEEYFL